ncbi:Lrp/AsnC family transcriptional regulator (plasmid) [Peteryoungia desertarenae]|uniref:Lrp/AsnC family transcriptional regulator n=1 Tax=Peteryoungia desertarenae TaxID=1813451 RepID=A0ABX6QTN3_9HYPH|nr:Lrp/AsnC family transcriptional regulator [Peteryoungia desertarenae]QLF71946.1 Lrp/AsnC family transcriptional regulator [Peteryoungia desertarenae]
MNQLDSYDRKILRVLGDEGRISWRDLASRIGLSFTPTLRRVRKLEDEGIIRGYTAVFDENRLLGTMGVFITVTLERQIKDALTTFEHSVASMPEVIGGYQTSGSSDYLIHAMVRDLSHYQQLLDYLTTVPGVARIQSNFAIKTFIRRSAAFAGDGTA